MSTVCQAQYQELVIPSGERQSATRGEGTTLPQASVNRAGHDRGHICRAGTSESPRGTAGTTGAYRWH